MPELFAVDTNRYIGALRDPAVAFDRVIADLAVRERFDAGAAPSFVNDVLLAASCREAGVTLVTANHADFARIGRHLRGFRAATPWPGA